MAQARQQGLGWIVLAASFGFALIQLDVTIVNVALPSIAAGVRNAARQAGARTIASGLSSRGFFAPACASPPRLDGGGGSKHNGLPLRFALPMIWKTAVLLFALLALGASASQGAPAQKPAMVAKAKPLGHSPHPFQDIGRTDLFHGYRCGASGCLPHQQGYQWGAVHKVTNPKDCRGTSEEFIEGCLAFAGVDGPLGHREFDPSFPHMVGID